jgi:hypothetical protein
MSVERYDPVANPYAPGAGTPPPALVGRDGILEGAEVSLQRLAASRSAQHQLLTGLRGVGKTVLLGKLGAVAERAGFRVIRQEAVGGDDTVRSLLRQARRAIEDLDHSQRVARALRSIESVSLTVAGSGFRVDRAEATPDREALSDVVVDLAAAAASEDLGIVLAIDEAQMVDAHDLRRILAGVHRCGQDGLPLWCVLAGLPNLVGIVAKAATYAERLFTVGDLGPLTPQQVVEAVEAPAAEIGVELGRATPPPPWWTAPTGSRSSCRPGRTTRGTRPPTTRSRPPTWSGPPPPPACRSTGRSSPPGSPASPTPRSATSGRWRRSGPARTAPARWPPPPGAPRRRWRRSGTGSSARA